MHPCSVIRRASCDRGAAAREWAPESRVAPPRRFPGGIPGARGGLPAIASLPQCCAPLVPWSVTRRLAASCRSTTTTEPRAEQHAGPAGDRKGARGWGSWSTDRARPLRSHQHRSRRAPRTPRQHEAGAGCHARRRRDRIAWHPATRPARLRACGSTPQPGVRAHERARDACGCRSLRGGATEWRGAMV